MFCLRFVRRDGHQPPMNSAGLLQALDPFTVADESGCLQQGRVAIAQTLTRNSPQSRFELTPWHSPESGTVISAWARLDNREALAASLGLPAGQLAATSDSELIFRCWQRWREGSVDRLIGDFVFAIYEPQTEQLFCARDQMGTRPLYYALTDDLFVCATSLPALRASQGGEAQLDQAWLARYLVGLSKSFSDTCYLGIKKVPPGHSLRVDLRSDDLRPYFQLAQIEPLHLNDPRDYVAAYREQLEEAVRCRLSSDYPIGSELSGGLDSATVTSLAARHLPDSDDRLQAFSFAAFEREPGLIAAVSNASDISHTHLVSRFLRDPFEAELQRAPRLLGSPAEHVSSTFHEIFYRRAEAVGVRTLLSGFGGDEFVTALAGTSLVPRELLAGRRYRELYNRLPGSSAGRLIQMLRLYRAQRRRAVEGPSPDPRMLQGWTERWERQLLRSEVSEKYQLKSAFFARGGFGRDYGDLKQYLLEDRWHPFVPTRMENCNIMALSRRIEYRWPLLDVRLVRLFLSIPSTETYYRGIDRYLHRRAVKGIVPEAVLKQRGKYVGELLPIPEQLRYLGHFRVEQELHPRIVDLVDAGKYRHQCDQVVRGYQAIGLENWLNLWQNIHAVTQLNNWLQRDFP